MGSILFLTVLMAFVAASESKIHPLAKCSPSFMDIKLSRQGIRDVRLDKWSVIPGCQSMADEDNFYVTLKLSANLPCGTTRIRNKVTGETVYYHRLIITEETGREHVFKITCLVSADEGVKSNIVKRNVLPAEFVEPDYIEITSEISGMAPIPELSVGVRQNGNLIGESATVSPGAPLTMEVYLDNESASTYGILVSYMLVTDTTDKNETIIYNGCTQDQYVFENFETTNGDYLKAKFRAFKFPGSTYLMFRGTVDVCLDKCIGIMCSNGDIGYGRRKRRGIADGATHQNKIFEVTMMTFIKFQEDPSQLESSDKWRFGLKQQEPPSIIYEAEKSRIEFGRSDEYTPFSIFGDNGSSSVVNNVLLLLFLVCCQHLI